MSMSAAALATSACPAKRPPSRSSGKEPGQVAPRRRDDGGGREAKNLIGQSVLIGVTSSLQTRREDDLANRRDTGKRESEPSVAAITGRRRKRHGSAAD